MQVDNSLEALLGSVVTSTMPDKLADSEQSPNSDQSAHSDQSEEPALIKDVDIVSPALPTRSVSATTMLPEPTPLRQPSVSHRKPRLRQCASDLLPYLNRLFCTSFAAPVAGWQWNIQLSAPSLLQCEAPQVADVLRWDIAWDDCLIDVDISLSTVAMLFSACGCDYPVSDLPEDIQLALGQTVLADFSQILEEAGWSPLALRSIAPPTTPSVATQNAKHTIAWQASTSDDVPTLHGMVHVNAKALERLADLARQNQSPGLRTGAWASLAIPAILELGYVYLSLSDVKSLRIGDTVFADACWRDVQGASVALRLADHWLICADINEDNTVTATSGRFAMTTAPYTFSDMDSTDDATLHSAGLESLPIRLSFDLGERTITLAELSNVQAGYVFDLALPVSRAVTLRANGMPVGEAELVDIDGRIGVAVTRFITPSVS